MQSADGESAVDSTVGSATVTAAPYSCPRRLVHLLGISSMLRALPMLMRPQFPLTRSEPPWLVVFLAIAGERQHLDAHVHADNRPSSAGASGNCPPFSYTSTAYHLPPSRTAWTCFTQPTSGRGSASVSVPMLGNVICRLVRPLHSLAVPNVAAERHRLPVAAHGGTVEIRRNPTGASRVYLSYTGPSVATPLPGESDRCPASPTSTGIRVSWRNELAKVRATSTVG